MAGLKHIKSKIKSVKNLKKITKALEVVSTVKLQKLKKKTESYRDFMEDFLRIANFIRTKINLFPESPDFQASKKELAILITSDRGLCGSLNAKVLKNFNTDFKPKKESSEVFCIWKKALEFAVRTEYTIAGESSLNDNISEDDLSTLYTFLLSAIDAKKYSNITLYFNYFKNTIVQVPVNFQLFPLTDSSFNQFTKDLWVNLDTYMNPDSQKTILLEPTPKIVRDELLKQLIQYMLYWAVLQNKSGEFASRMIAMKNATDNCWWMITSLSRKFNKERQRIITQEIGEIVSAKMAIEG